MSEETRYAVEVIAEPLRPGEFETWVKLDRGWRMMTRGSLADCLDDLTDFRHGQIPGATRFRIETVREASP